MEDALKRLDKLTQEEARMAAAEVLRLIQIVNNQVTTVNNKVTTINNKVTTVINGKSAMLATRKPMPNLRALVRRERHKENCPKIGERRR